MATEVDLFSDIALALRSWSDAAADAVTDGAADLQWTESSDPYRKIQAALVAGGVDRVDARAIFSECLRGMAVSILTMIDGGTELAEKGRIFLVDDEGRRFADGLHEEFVSYLITTGELA